MGLDSFKKAKEYGQMIHAAGDQLLELFNVIINLIDSERVADFVKAESLDLSEFAKELCVLMEPSIYAKGLKFKLELDKNLPFIICNRIKLKRALLNLLSNAVKFTKNGEIIFSIKLLDIENKLANLEIEISDTGIGICADKLNKIFDHFYRAHPPYLAQYSGHGIGLYLVKEILTVLGGEIKVSSEEGKGTSFILHFHFPLSDKLSDKTEIISPSTSNTNKINPILIAEDNAIVLRVVKTLLEKAGYNVIVTMDGKAALDASQNNSFIWALLDIGLPKLRGTEAAQQYRDWEKENNKLRLPIFALTGHAVNEVRKECKEAGINQVFTKPLTDKIIQEIESIIKIV
ncbi:MAG: ATP-binding protein [Rickettsiella sp.]|nr:ATP-binding protein [Rickettsiella sp.]